jgi:Kef-type K+ transport system membrane component KefB
VIARRAWEHTPWGGEGLLLLLDALVFIGLVAAAGYGGTSPLYGAYVAGLSVAYLCSVEAEKIPTPEVMEMDVACDSSSSPAEYGISPPSLMSAFDTYVAKPLAYLLLPVFFGSIGYSIPFVPLFRGRVIWRGIVYAVLMALGKILCGAWVWRRKSWRAALFLGGAMVARGEIGLL